MTDKYSELGKEPLWRREFTSRFLDVDENHQGEQDVWWDADFEEVMDWIGELIISQEQRIREKAQLDILNDLIQEYKPNNSWFMAVEKIRKQLSKQER